MEAMSILARVPAAEAADLSPETRRLICSKALKPACNLQKQGHSKLRAAMFW